MRRNYLVMLSLVFVAQGLAQTNVPQTESEVVSQALRVNPSVAASRQHLTEAQARLAEVAGGRRFQLSFVGTLSESSGRIAQPSTNQSYTTGEGSLVSPFPNLARTGAQIDLARAQLMAVQFQLRRTELDVEFRARQAYVEVFRAREAQSIAEENLAQATRQQDDTQARITAGDVPAADILKAQVQVAQNQAALARSKIAVSIAQQNLNDLLQRDLAEPLNLEASADSLPLVLTSEAAVALALRRSPDVLEADANVIAARSTLRIARHGRDTDFSLQLTHARTTDPTAYSHLTTLSLSVSLPLLDGGVSKQQIRQAESLVAQAEAARTLARRMVALAVQQAVLDVQGDEANAEATRLTQEIARQSLEKVRLAYAAGLTTTRDVLDAQLVYSQARIEHNAALHDLAIARAHLSQLLGGPLP